MDDLPCLVLQPIVGYVSLSLYIPVSYTQRETNMLCLPFALFIALCMRKHFSALFCFISKFVTCARNKCLLAIQLLI